MANETTFWSVALQQRKAMERPNVRFWHKADITTRSTNVRFWGFNGLQAFDAQVMPMFIAFLWGR